MVSAKIAPICEPQINELIADHSLSLKSTLASKNSDGGLITIMLNNRYEHDALVFRGSSACVAASDQLAGGGKLPASFHCSLVSNMSRISPIT